MNRRPKTRELSPAFRAALPAAQRKGVAVRAQMPKCGAKSRVTGEPCRQPVKEEGKRCRYHGGATPKGRDWHRRQIGRKGQSEKSYAGKLRALDRRDREAEERRAAMAPDEREAHESRRAAKRPGTPAQRSANAAGRKMAKEMADLLGRPKLPSAEAERLAKAIRELEHQARQRDTEVAADDDSERCAKDIFG